MGDDNKIRDVIDAVTGVAKAVPVYQDVVQPAAQEIGTGGCPEFCVNGVFI